MLPQRGLTDFRHIGCVLGEQPTLGKEGIRPALVIRLCHLPPLTPISRAVSMRSVHSVGSHQDQRSWIDSSRLASSGTDEEDNVEGVDFTHSPTCIPWLHSHYRSFNATMDALTPARVSIPCRSPCFTHMVLMNPSVSNHQRLAVAPLFVTQKGHGSTSTGRQPLSARGLYAISRVRDDFAIG